MAQDVRFLLHTPLGGIARAHSIAPAIRGVPAAIARCGEDITPSTSFIEGMSRACPLSSPVSLSLSHCLSLFEATAAEEHTFNGGHAGGLEGRRVSQAGGGGPPCGVPQPGRQQLAHGLRGLEHDGAPPSESCRVDRGKRWREAATHQRRLEAQVHAGSRALGETIRQVLCDPWLVGSLTFGGLPWLYEGKKDTSGLGLAAAEGTDILLLSQVRHAPLRLAAARLWLSRHLTTMKKSRIVILGLGTARQKMVLE